jgi:hypothetical protein
MTIHVPYTQHGLPDKLELVNACTSLGLSQLAATISQSATASYGLQPLEDIQQCYNADMG